jgi:cell division protein ZapA
MVIMERIQSETSVHIFDETYRIASHLDADMTRQVADFVDTKMREIEARASHLSKSRIAVLAAMEMAADLLQIRQEREEMLRQTHDQIKKLSELVEQCSSLLPLTSDWIAQRGKRQYY